MKETVNTPLEVARHLVEDRVRQYNDGSMPQDRTVCGATEVVYVRKDLLSLLREHPHLAGTAVPACEFEQLGKTLTGLDIAGFGAVWNQYSYNILHHVFILENATNITIYNIKNK